MSEENLFSGLDSPGPAKIPRNEEQVRRLAELLAQNRRDALGPRYAIEEPDWHEQHMRAENDRWQAERYRDRLLKRLVATGRPIEASSRLLDQLLYDVRVVRSGDPWGRLWTGIEDGTLFRPSPEMEYESLALDKRRWLDRAVRVTAKGVEPALLRRLGISQACAMYAARLADLEP